MKHQTTRTIAILGLFFMLAIAGVHAQSGTRIEVHVPFDFSAGEATFKAGAYSVRRVSDRTLAIRSADGKASAVVQGPLAIGAREYRSGERLVFNRYGDRYFLFQAWLKADSGHQFFPSTAERMTARQNQKAKKGNEPQWVEVVARVR